MTGEKPFDVAITGDNPRVLAMRGVIDERVVLSPYLAEERGLSVVIDGSGIKRMTSFGVGRWIRWMDAVSARNNRVYFYRASPVMSAQLFHVARFLPDDGALISLDAPYRCGKCNADATFEVRTDALVDGAPFPTFPCKTCGGVMTLDDDEEGLRQMLAPFLGRPVPEEVLSVLRPAPTS